MSWSARKIIIFLLITEDHGLLSTKLLSFIKSETCSHWQNRSDGLTKYRKKRTLSNLQIATELEETCENYDQWNVHQCVLESVRTVMMTITTIVLTLYLYYRFLWKCWGNCIMPSVFDQKCSKKGFPSIPRMKERNSVRHKNLHSMN